MRELLLDIRFSLRLLRKDPFLTVIAVLSLALGIGANTAIFSVIRTTLFRPLAVDHPDGLVEIFTSSREGAKFSGSSYPDFQDLRNRTGLAGIFTELAAYAPLDLLVRNETSSELVAGEIVTGSYFQTLGVRMALGRPFTSEEVERRSSYLTVLSHGFWVQHMGGDASVIGRTLSINGRPFTIVGVAPPQFRGLRLDRSPQIWVGMVQRPELVPEIFTQGNPFTDRGKRWLDVAGRLEPGVTLQKAAAALNVKAGQLAASYPDSNRGRALTLLPASAAALPGARRNAVTTFLGMLVAATGCALLIACANVGNLLLVRGLARHREIAVRLTVGANRWKLLRQLTIEGLVLSALGIAVGLLIAAWSLRLLGSVTLPGNLVIERLGLGVDGYAMGWACLLGVLTGVVFGLIPALQATNPDLTSSLKNQSWSLKPATARLRAGLVAFQVALCLLLLIGAALFARSLWNALDFDLGMEAEKVALARVNLGLNDYDPQRAAIFYRQARERLESLPIVESASVTNALPVVRANARFKFKINIEGYEPRAGEDMKAGLTFVGPDYFRTTGISLVRGREVTETDTVGSPKVVLVNEALARRFWGTTDVVGKRLQPPEEPFLEVVGVVADVKDSLQGEVEPRFFLPLEQYMDYVGTGELILVVRAQGDPARVLPLIRETILNLDPTLPVQSMASFREELEAVLRPQRAGLILLSLFSLIALVLATVGIHGVVAYQVRQRQREIGIRLALGAQRSSVLWLVLKWGGAPAVVGILGGVGLALAALRLIARFLYGIEATDASTFVVSSLIVLAVSLTASYFPARRATKLDPALVLRYE